jgi:hypothetical protein
VAQSVPVLSASPGVTFEYDPDTGTYKRHVVTNGQVLLEYADTIGRAHWDLSLGYQYLQFDDLGGKPLRHLSEPRPLADPYSEPLFAIPRMSVDVSVQQAAANVTYGVTDSVDVQLVVPVVHANLARRETIQFPGSAPQSGSSAAGEATGLGDVFLRGKASIIREGPVFAAASLGLRLPTGDDANFLGSGLTIVTPAVYLSSSTWELSPNISARMALDLAMAIAANDVERSQGRWAVGFDASWKQRFHGGVSLLGVHDVGSLLDPHDLNTRLCIDGCNGVPPRSEEAPIFGIQSGRVDQIAVSIGTRIVLWHDTLLLFANVTIPFLNQGLTTEPVPLVGLEVAL